MSTLAKAMDFDSPYFSKDAAGRPITRERACVCGRPYVQALLSDRVLKMVERRGPDAVRKFMAQIPELYVPVECPTCERRSLGHEARKAGEPFLVSRHSEAAD